MSAERRPDHAPVKLLAHERQIDEIDERGLQLTTGLLPKVRIDRREMRGSGSGSHGVSSCSSRSSRLSRVTNPAHISRVWPVQAGSDPTLYGSDPRCPFTAATPLGMRKVRSSAAASREAPHPDGRGAEVPQTAWLRARTPGVRPVQAGSDPACTRQTPDVRSRWGFARRRGGRSLLSGVGLGFWRRRGRRLLASGCLRPA